MSLLASLLAVAALALGTPLKVTLTAPTRTPRVGTEWHYVVRATVNGKPVSARLTAQIVDPIGGVHPVEFGRTTRKIVRRPFRGVFRDFVIWPPSSRGIPLKLRLIVVTAHARRVVSYAVTPRA